VSVWTLRELWGNEEMGGLPSCGSSTEEHGHSEALLVSGIPHGDIVGNWVVSAPALNHSQKA
jgi:hypothetical protein